jgi:Fe-S-cluster containining protein
MIPSMEKNPETNLPLTLTKIYRLYDSQVASVDAACRKYCAGCCTANVTMTRLEGLLIGASIPPARIIEAVGAEGIFPRYQPALSTNGYVKLCRTVECDDVNEAVLPEKCPFLEDNACTIYPVRPFGCRCMISTAACEDNGSAEIDDFTLTINTVFLQFIEHLDKDGFFGNMIDVLIHLTSEKRNHPGTCRVVPNHAIPALMVPPAHRDRIKDLINTLDRMITAGQTPG